MLINTGRRPSADEDVQLSNDSMPNIAVVFTSADEEDVPSDTIDTVRSYDSSGTGDGTRRSPPA